MSGTAFGTKPAPLMQKDSKGNKYVLRAGGLELRSLMYAGKEWAIEKANTQVDMSSERGIIGVYEGSRTGNETIVAIVKGKQNGSAVEFETVLAWEDEQMLLFLLYNKREDSDAIKQAILDLAEYLSKNKLWSGYLEGETPFKLERS